MYIKHISDVIKGRLSSDVYLHVLWNFYKPTHVLRERAVLVIANFLVW